MKVAWSLRVMPQVLMMVQQHFDWFRSGRSKYGLKPMAKILSAAAAGIEPRIMGAGPIEAIKKLLRVRDLL